MLEDTVLEETSLETLDVDTELDDVAITVDGEVEGVITDDVMLADVVMSVEVTIELDDTLEDGAEDNIELDDDLVLLE